MSFALRGDRPELNVPKKAIMIADTIAQEIFEQGLSSGTQLATEAQMLQEFKVGRATLREAMRLLEAEGLIVVRSGANGGAVVSQPSLERLARMLSILFAVSGTTIGEVVVARRLFEPEMCSLAAQNADDEEIRLLEEIVERGGGALHDERGSVDTSKDFHNTIAIASKNRALAAFWLASSQIINMQVGPGYHLEDRRGAHLAHKKILDAIRSRDPQRAGALMTKHMTAVFDYFEDNESEKLADAVRFIASTTVLR